MASAGRGLSSLSDWLDESDGSDKSDWSDWSDIRLTIRPASRSQLFESRIVHPASRERGAHLMKAIRIHNFGGPDVMVLEEIPKPQPGAGEIRIRVIAAGVNPADWKIREGSLGRVALPATMGVDVAGIVDEVGAGVDNFHLGDRVFAKPTMTRAAMPNIPSSMSPRPHICRRAWGSWRRRQSPPRG